MSWRPKCPVPAVQGHSWNCVNRHNLKDPSLRERGHWRSLHRPVLGGSGSTIADGRVSPLKAPLHWPHARIRTGNIGGDPMRNELSAKFDQVVRGSELDHSCCSRRRTLPNREYRLRGRQSTRASQQCVQCDVGCVPDRILPADPVCDRLLGSGDTEARQGPHVRST